MTCIVAIKDQGKVYFGADSFLSDKEFAYPMQASKIFRKGPFIFGYCGSVRAGKVFQYDLDLPPVDYQNLDRYMNKEFITALMDCAERNRLLIDEDKDPNDVADLIVGINGRLYEVQSHVQSVEWTVEYMAVGSGARAALGSLFSTKGLPPRQRLTTALTASSLYSVGVGKPFKYLIG